MSRIGFKTTRATAVHSRGEGGRMNNYADRLKKENYEVRLVALEVGQHVVERFHYARGGANTATYIHGLFKKGCAFDYEAVGVAWWIPPTKSAAIATYPENWQGVLALSRLVILPEVPKNGCSFLLSRSMKMIDRKRWPCLVTYADEWQGHHGTIYKATNWHYAGKTHAEAVYQLDGRMIARKAGPKTRTHAEMLAMGCQFIGRFSKHKFVEVSP